MHEPEPEPDALLRNDVFTVFSQTHDNLLSKLRLLIKYRLLTHRDYCSGKKTGKTHICALCYMLELEPDASLRDGVFIPINLGHEPPTHCLGMIY